MPCAPYLSFSDRLACIDTSVYRSRRPSLCFLLCCRSGCPQSFSCRFSGMPDRNEKSAVHTGCEQRFFYFSVSISFGIQDTVWVKWICLGISTGSTFSWR